MNLRLRLWLPLAGVLTLLLSVALMFLYGIPATQTRVEGYARSFTLAEAAETADALSGASREDWPGVLDRSVGDSGRQALVVDAGGRVVAESGPRLVEAPATEVLRRAARGDRVQLRKGDLTTATVPLVRDGGLFGGVVMISRDSDNSLYGVFLRSGVEAAAIATVLGSGLMLLLATHLSRRIDSLTLGARDIEEGKFASRIEPGFDDELGHLAKSFNAMAAKLEDSFFRLEEKNETLDSVLNNLSEGVLAADLEGGVVFANRSAREMLGLLGEPPHERVPDAFEDFDLPGAVARCAGDKEYIEARVQDGETSLRVNLDAISALDHHRGGVLVVVQDLSEGRRLEASQQRFLANAAHELKTPITTILGASELLLAGDDDPEVRRRFLGHIHSEAARMKRLSETLLKLARTGLDSREPDLGPVDLGEAVRDAVRRMQPLVEDTKLSLAVDAGRGGRVLADREWLGQVLLILAHNAIQHAGEREVRLRAEDASVAVEDGGPSIPEEELPHVFERFYRGKGGPGGFGLGLPLCKELVERMGGEVSLSSGRDEGTRAEVRLPKGSLSKEVRDA